MTVSNLFLKFIASPINAGAIAMVGGLIIIPIVSFITPKMKQQEVEEIFECYEEKVVVELKESLPDEELN